MTFTHRLTISALALLTALGVTFGAAWVGYRVARADDSPPLVVDATDPLPSSHPYRDSLVAQLDTASSAAPEAAPAPSTPAQPAEAAGAADAAATATVPPIASPLDELAALKAKYDALKAAKSGGGSKDLIWFAYALLGAAVLRVLLAAINAYRGDKPKKWAKWTALALAVPIALLTYYGMGTGWWQAIVMAGAGPGAIVANEVVKSFQKEPA